MDTGNIMGQAALFGRPDITWHERGDSILGLRCAEDKDQTEFLLLKDKFPYLFEKGYQGLGSVMTAPGLSAATAIRVEGNIIRLTVTVKNHTHAPVHSAYARLPLMMDQAFRNGEKHIFTRNVLRNACLIGEGAYVTWSRLCGQGPMLVLLAQPGTSVKHFHVDTGYGMNRMDASFEGMYALELMGCEDVLQSGEARTYGFSIFFLMDERSLAQALALQNGVGLWVLPGMVAPRGEKARLDVLSGRGAYTLIPQDGDEAEKTGEHSHCLRFGGYGERRVRLCWQDGSGETVISFFATESISHIYQKQAAFIARNQFETDPDDPCFHGLLAWDLTHKRRVNRAFNPYDNWMAGGSDEIGLVSAVFLAEKNVYLPEDAQISVLCAFETDFIQARLTEQPGFRVHRMVPWYEMFEPWSGHGADDVWRAYNYVHVVNVYYALYRIARQYDHPSLKTPGEYLLKAYQYSMAMFAYWMFPEGKGATHYGNMGESTLALCLEQALLKEGLYSEAAALQKRLDDKAGTLLEREYPFASEMAFDTTAFEAVYAYALRSKNQALQKRVIDADRGTRGRHPVWHKYQVDIRQQGDSSWNASYMTQLGAWPLMDQLLRGQSKSPDMAMAAYAAYLAGFSLYNAGGCWEASPENAGAMLWVLDERAMQYGKKNRLTMHMSGEGPLGLYGALKAAAFYRIAHPKHGETGLGCAVTREGKACTILPQDGLGLRYIDLIDDFALELSGGRIQKIQNDSSFWQVHMCHPGGVTLRLRAPAGTAIKLSGQSALPVYADGWHSCELEKGQSVLTFVLDTE